MVVIKNKIGIIGKCEIFNAKTGEKLYEGKNLVVDTGLNLIWKRMKNNTYDYFTHIGVGTDDTAVTAGDTELGTELLRNSISSMVITANSMQTEAQFAETDAVGTWKEVAIFNAASTGIMFNRTIIDFEKLNTDIVIVRFTHTITNTV